MTTILTPNASDFYMTVKRTVKEILPGQRISILMPRSLCQTRSCLGAGSLDWEEIEMVESDFRPTFSQKNLFVQVRYNEKDERSDVVVDVCRL